MTNHDWRFENGIVVVSCASRRGSPPIFRNYKQKIPDSPNPTNWSTVTTHMNGTGPNGMNNTAGSVTRWAEFGFLLPFVIHARLNKFY